MLTVSATEFSVSATRSLSERAKHITAREIALYMERTAGSRRANERARKVLPLGVP